MPATKEAAPSLPMTLRLQRLSASPLVRVVLLFLTVKVSLLLLAATLSILVPRDERVRPYDPELEVSWLRIWSQWDVGGFVGLARRGYALNQEGITSYFPLYSYVIKAASLVIPNAFLAGVVVSHLAMLGALIVLYQLTVLEFGRSDVGLRAVFYLLIFPTSFFTSTAYSEALLLLTATASFYLLRRGRWLWAGVMGMLASATRISGLAVGPALAVAYLLRRGFHPLRPGWGILGVLLVPLGLAFYGAVLWVTVGEPLALWRAQAEDFGRYLVPPWQSLWHSVEALGGQHLHPDFPETWAINLVNLTSTVFFLVLTALAFRKLPPAYGVYMLFDLLFHLVPSPMQDRPLHAMLRYNLMLFPAFMLLGLYGRSLVVDRLISAVFLMLLGLFTALFVRSWLIPGIY